MSRFAAGIGVGLATLFGVAIAYTTFQPELDKQRAERQGVFQEQHPSNDRVISRAIMSDLREAKQQVEGDSKGFAWGLRQAIWGPKIQHSQSQAPNTVTNKQELNDSEQNSGGS